MSYTKLTELKFGSDRGEKVDEIIRYDKCILLSEEQIEADNNALILEPFKLRIGFSSKLLQGTVEIQEQGSNIILKSTSSILTRWVVKDGVDYKGKVLVSCIDTKVTELENRCDYIRESIINMENRLLEATNNSGIKGILSIRQEYLEIGEDIIFIDKVLQAIDQGKLVMLMQNSYVALGVIMDRLKLLKKHHELLGLTILKDIDAYTSMANNNINNRSLCIAIIATVIQFAYMLSATGDIINAVIGCIGFIGILGAVLYKGKKLRV